MGDEDEHESRIKNGVYYFPDEDKESSKGKSAKLTSPKGGI